MVDDTDRQCYLREIGWATKQWDWTIVSFALMSSHIHTGALAGGVAPGSYFGPLHSRYAVHWRCRHGGLGPVFADRPSNFEVPMQRMSRLVAYHHRNPVRAGVAREPRESRWTSHRMYLRLDPAPRWLCVERALARMDFADTEAGRNHFDQFVCEVNLDDFADRPPTLAAARDGREQQVAIVRGPARPAPMSDHQWSALVAMASETLGVPAELLHLRAPHIMALRRLITRFAHEHLGQTLTHVAARFGVSVGTVHHWLHRRPHLVAEIEPAMQELRQAWDGALLSDRYGSRVGRQENVPR